MKKAYLVQALLAEAVARSGAADGGFKAALTNEAAGKKFSANFPLFGPLFKRGLLKPDAVVDSKECGNLIIEMEIGYVAGARIDKPIPDVSSLKGFIKEIRPVVEFPDFRFLN